MGEVVQRGLLDSLKDPMFVFNSDQSRNLNAWPHLLTHALRARREGSEVPHRFPHSPSERHADFSVLFNACAKCSCHKGPIPEIRRFRFLLRKCGYKKRDKRRVQTAVSLDASRARRVDRKCEAMVDTSKSSKPPSRASRGV